MGYFRTFRTTSIRLRPVIWAHFCQSGSVNKQFQRSPSAPANQQQLHHWLQPWGLLPEHTSPSLQNNALGFLAVYWTLIPFLPVQCSCFRFLESTVPNMKVYRKKQTSKQHIAIMGRGTGGFFFLLTQNSSGCYRANQALSVLELKYNSAKNVLNLSFGKYTFISWSQTAAAHGQNRAWDTLCSDTLCSHSSSNFRR